MKNSIDFLGIGVQKAASSWLWELLKEHPNVWMPPKKELHYFDRSSKYASPSFLASDSFVDRMNGAEAHDIHFRRKIGVELTPLIDSHNIEEIKWNLKYYLETYNDEWYKSLFEQGKGKLRGEITPAYSILKKEDIQHIKELFPSLKVILILRDPIERTWSHVRFHMKQQKLDSKSNIDAIKNFIDSDLPTKGGDYVNIIKNWSSVFSKEQLFIGFYDEIMEDMECFISKISHFLDINEEPLIKSNVAGKKVNVSVKLDMPVEIRSYLIEKYDDDIKYLSTVFDKYPKKWLNEYKLRGPIG